MNKTSFSNYHFNSEKPLQIVRDLVLISRTMGDNQSPYLQCCLDSVWDAEDIEIAKKNYNIHRQLCDINEVSRQNHGDYVKRTEELEKILLKAEGEDKARTEIKVTSIKNQHQEFISSYHTKEYQVFMQLYATVQKEKISQLSQFVKDTKEKLESMDEDSSNEDKNALLRAKNNEKTLNSTSDEGQELLQRIIDSGKLSEIEKLLSNNSVQINNIEGATKRTADDETFKFPSKFAKNIQAIPQKEIEIKNRFTNLEDNNPTDTEMENAKSETIQPFLIPFQENYKLVIQEIRDSLQEDIDAKLTSKNVKITPASNEQKEKIDKYLADNHIGYISTTPKSEVPRKYVIRGLSLETDINDIEKEIKELGLHLIKITRMNHLKTKKPMPLLLAQFKQQTTRKEIENIKVLDLVTVKFEKYGGNGLVVQCFNCQRFGHHSSNCKLPSRCVKCSEAHDSRQCPKSKEEKPICANCNGSHPASYRKCEMAPKLKQKTLNTEKQKIPTSQDFPDLPERRENKRNSQEKNHQENYWFRRKTEKLKDAENLNDIFTLLKEIKNLFKGVNIAQLLKELQEKSSKLDKLFVLTQYFEENTAEFV